MHFHADALAGAREQLVRHLEEAGSISLSELRDELGTSRKFAQALLEHFDREKLTMRSGDRHVLRRRSYAER